eukprot:TRINITY_DN25185_c0_g4_i1.p1 TRINITY_DN25185_c0_g4~~TRINITY_DN25185_c0_g4_i1.p1  ORF type:complete len:370 (-),score=105.58 TRINITY_DN25185_c0_g4_i1:76-1185(-)
MSFLPTDETTATKSMRLDDLHQKGKAATIGADSWALQQTGVHTMVQTHNESISALSTTVRSLEQQVKAIARVLSTQNVQKLTENTKLAHDDLKKSLERYVNDKQRDLMTMVEKEVNEVMDAKNGLGKKIDMVEERLMTLITSRTDEANQARHAIKEDIEKIQVAIEDIPTQAEKHEKMIKDVDYRVMEMKKRFREMEAEHEVANVEQDKAVAAMLQEVKTALNDAKEKLSEESKSLTKYLKRHEGVIEDRFKEMHDIIDKEKTERFDTHKRINEDCYEKVHGAKQEIQKVAAQLSADIDRKIQPFYASFGEIKQLIGQESTQREVAVQNLTRGLAKEKKDRDHDEERLVGMISSCTQAIARMQNRPVTM